MPLTLAVLDVLTFEMMQTHYARAAIVSEIMTRRNGLEEKETNTAWMNDVQHGHECEETQTNTGRGCR